MKTFVTVIQISASKFDVFFFNGESVGRINRGNDYKGVMVTCFESNKQNDEYCFTLANNMNG